MARKRREAPADIFIDLASKLPWWASLFLALLSYFLLKAYAVSPVETPMMVGKIAESIIPIYLRAAATVGQFVLPLLLCIAAMIAFFRSSKTKESERPSIPASKAGSAPQAQNSRSAPTCPTCSSPMVKRQVGRGANKGQSFWGCSQYPSCKGTRPVV